MQTLTRNIIKEIRSLEQRRSRREQHAWLAEGNKMVGDLLAAAPADVHPSTTANPPCLRLVATANWWLTHAQYASLALECYEVTPAEMQRISLLQAPQDVLAVFPIPDHASVIPPATEDQLCIMLDEVQDPGNLGTIIRTADWFGVRHIFCTPGTADCYNPKVVQATMSALARVQLHYFCSKEQARLWLQSSADSRIPVLGTFLDGTDIYHSKLEARGVLVMGNEGRGVSDEVAQCVTDRLLIPHFAPDGQHVESLNVGIATAICLSELRRRQP